METSPIQKIEKEDIKNLSFNKREVLPVDVAIKKRWDELLRAQSLGNLQQSKVHITFETADQKAFIVYITIWAVGQEFVTLKGGTHIPINAVLEVN